MSDIRLEVVRTAYGTYAVQRVVTREKLWEGASKAKAAAVAEALRGWATHGGPQAGAVRDYLAAHDRT